MALLVSSSQLANESSQMVYILLFFFVKVYLTHSYRSFFWFLKESLDEETVKDVLEGDNKYTCSQCQEKVRAEKR